MSREFLKKPSFQTVVATTLLFMSLDIFLPLNPSLRAQSEYYPFRLTVTLPKRTYGLGEYVNITWTLTNLGDKTVTLYTSIDRIPNFVVLDSAFNRVFEYTSFKAVAAVIFPYSIAPTHNITASVTWGQIYDDLSINFDVRPWIVRLKPVPPGVYFIYGIFESPTYEIAVQTPPLRIEINGE